MDPKDRLKRYLEQRRELGESELVLDGMTVDEVMSIVSGAVPGSKPRRTQRAVDSDPDRAQVASGPPDLPAGERAARDEPGSGAAGAPPSITGTGSVPDTDWRAALRASGAAPEPKKPGGGSPPSVGPTPKPPSTSKKYEFPAAADVEADTRRSATPPGTPQPPAASPPPSPTSAATEASAGAAPAPSQPASRIPGVDAPLGIVVGDPARDLFGTSVGKLGSLQEIADVVAECTRCPLYASATNPVPGEGSPNAELVCVGEAPGEKEDLSGRPFVGQSGELLTKILAAIGLRRVDVFSCNVLKHRPPGNRYPLPEEVGACSPYLVQQLELIRPKVIVAFGTFAAQTLLNTKIPIGKLRGSVHRYHGVPLIVTYHPAALLRNPAWKRPTWEDVQLARRILDNAPRA